MNKFNIVDFLKDSTSDIFNFIKFPATRDSRSVLFFGFQNNEGVLSVFGLRMDSEIKI